MQKTKMGATSGLGTIIHGAGRALLKGLSTLPQKPLFMKKRYQWLLWDHCWLPLFRIRQKIRSFANHRQSERTLLLVRTDGLGDMTLWLGAASRIVAHHRTLGFKIRLACRDYAVPLAEASGLFDDVIGVNFAAMRRFSGRYRLLKRLNDRDYERAVNPRMSREVFLDDSILRFVQAREKIGIDMDGGGLMTGREKAMSDRWYTSLMRPPALAMELVNNSWFASCLTGSEHQPEVFSFPKAPVRKKEIQEPYFLVFPFTADIRRNWPVERFSALIDLLHARTGLPCVLAGAAADRASEADLAILLDGGKSAYVRNRIGCTDFLEYFSLISGAEFILTNDSGQAHLGIALGVQTIVLASENTLGRMLDYRSCVPDQAHTLQVIHAGMDCRDCDGRCIHPLSERGAWQCMERLSLEWVWQSLKDRMGRSDRPVDTIHTGELAQGSVAGVA